MGFNSDLLWLLVSFILTVMVFSYLLGDNPFFRFVSAIFIGITAGYFAVVILYQVLITRLAVPLVQGSMITLVPLFLSGLLLMKLSPRLTRLGGPSMAVLVGVGAAVAVGGAVLGTLFGQVRGALSFFVPGSGGDGGSAIRIIEGVFFLIGTLATLAYFNFRARQKKELDPHRTKLMAVFAAIGKIFIAITMGAVFAGVLTAAVSALVERSDFLISTIMMLVR